MAPTNPTKSEALFERFLYDNSIPFQRIEATKDTPDYEITIGGKAVVVPAAREVPSACRATCAARAIRAWGSVNCHLLTMRARLLVSASGSISRSNS